MKAILGNIKNFNENADNRILSACAVGFVAASVKILCDAWISPQNPQKLYNHSYIGDSLNTCVFTMIAGCAIGKDRAAYIGVLCMTALSGVAVAATHHSDLSQQFAREAVIRGIVNTVVCLVGSYALSAIIPQSACVNK